MQRYVSAFLSSFFIQIPARNISDNDFNDSLKQSNVIQILVMKTPFVKTLKLRTLVLVVLALLEMVKAVKVSIYCCQRIWRENIFTCSDISFFMIIGREKNTAMNTIYLHTYRPPYIAIDLSGFSGIFLLSH